MAPVPSEARLFACLKPLRAPSVVRGALVAHFYEVGLSPGLLVSRGSVLEVYEILAGGTLRQRDAYALQGEILHLQLLRGRGLDGRDAVLVHLASLKLALVQWDPTAVVAASRPLHNFEAEADNAVQTPMACHLFAADPLSRCAAMQTAGNLISVAPVSVGAAEEGQILGGRSGLGVAPAEPEDGDVEPRDALEAAPAAAAVGVAATSWETFRVELGALGIRGSLKDMVFLAGYLEPTLCLLVETPQSYVGRVASLSYTCICYGVALDTARGAGAVVWSCAVLPHDAHGLCAAPGPRRGVLVLADNSLTYLDQQLIDAVALNAFADMKVEDAKLAPGYGRSHAGALRPHRPPLGVATPPGTTATFLSPDHAAILLPSGQFLLLQLAPVPLSRSDYKLGHGSGLGWGKGQVQLHLETAAALPCGGHLTRVPLPPRCAEGCLGVAAGVFVSSTAADAQLLLVDLLPQVDESLDAKHPPPRPLDIGAEETKGIGFGADDVVSHRGAEEAKTTAVPVRKRRRLATALRGFGAAEEEDFLYGAPLEQSASAAKASAGRGATPWSQCRVRVLDALLSLGPAAGAAVGLQAGATKDATASEIVFGVGREDAGCLVQLKNSFRPSIGAASAVSGAEHVPAGARQMEPVYLAGAVGGVYVVMRRREEGDDVLGMAVMNTAGGARCFEVGVQAVSAAKAAKAGPATAVVLAEKAAGEAHGFRLDATTLGAGAVLGRSFGLQVYAATLDEAPARATEEGVPMSAAADGDGEGVAAADASEDAGAGAGVSEAGGTAPDDAPRGATERQDVTGERGQEGVGEMKGVELEELDSVGAQEPSETEGREGPGDRQATGAGEEAQNQSPAPLSTSKESSSPRVFIRVTRLGDGTVASETEVRFGLGLGTCVQSVAVEDTVVALLLSDGRVLVGDIAESGTVALREAVLPRPAPAEDALGADTTAETYVQPALAMTLFTAPANVFEVRSGESSASGPQSKQGGDQMDKIGGAAAVHEEGEDEEDAEDDEEEDEEAMDVVLPNGHGNGLVHESEAADLAALQLQFSLESEPEASAEALAALPPSAAQKEEETQLYGRPLQSSLVGSSEPSARAPASSAATEGVIFADDEDSEPTYLAVVRANGSFQVLLLPELRCVLSVAEGVGKGQELYRTTADEAVAQDSSADAEAPLEVGRAAVDSGALAGDCDVAEVVVAPVGPTARPELWCWCVVLRTDDGATQLYRFRRSAGAAMVLQRLPETFITQSYANLRRTQAEAATAPTHFDESTHGARPASPTAVPPPPITRRFALPQLWKFRFCEGRAGVFLSTQRPAVVLGERGLASLVAADAPPTKTPFSMMGFGALGSGLGFLLSLREGDAMAANAEAAMGLARRRVLLASCSGLGAGLSIGAAAPGGAAALVRRMPLRALALGSGAGDDDDEGRETHNLGRGWTPRHICYLGDGTVDGLAAELREPTYLVTVSRASRLGFREARTALAEAATSIRQIIETVELEAAEQQKEQLGMGGGAGVAHVGGIADLRHVEHRNFGEPNLSIGRPPPLIQERYEAWLVQPNRGLGLGFGAAAAAQVAPVCRMALSRDERALCAATVRLRSQAPRRGAIGDLGVRKLYVLVGTSRQSPAGEDASGGGRVLLFEVVSSRGPDTDGAKDGAGALGLKLSCAQTIIDGGVASISAAAQCGENVVLCHGRRVTVHRWLGARFEQVAFHDADFYGVSVSVAPYRKECTVPSHQTRGMHRPRCRVFSAYIQVTDVFQGQRLLRFDEHSAFSGSRKLKFLAKERFKDFRGENLTGGFWFSPPGLDLCVCDALGNLRLSRYDPTGLESQSKSFLAMRSNVHVGQRFNAAVSVQMHAPRADVTMLGGRRAGPPRDRFGLVMVSLEGGVSGLVPCKSERQFRRLFMLQTILEKALWHPLACNPRAHRRPKLRRAGTAFAVEAGDSWKNILDGELLWRFVYQPTDVQEEFAGAVGVSVARVLTSLLDLDMAFVKM